MEAVSSTPMKLKNNQFFKHKERYSLHFETPPAPLGLHQKQTLYSTSKPRKSWFFKHFFIDNNYRLS
uniref:Putative regulatory system sensor kinase n=1 Tax=uncultured marine Nitrospinaceae bacterium TaxID=482920 RepID=A4GJ23_9BACT|nr:putative regulatory system sensor kinase [uncultured marine Nitrospinaceae bacterium]